MDDTALMERAIEVAATARAATSPNPWVGAALETVDGSLFVGATEPPGGRHAERVALDAAHAAGVDTAGSTMAVTLEPCCHTGRTGPCSTALIDAGVRRVLVGAEDPDPRVCGGGIAALRDAAVDTQVGVLSGTVDEQLAAYLHHRRTGRPWVVLKLAATLDGRIAAPDGSSNWITGEAARRDVHRWRAESDAVLVGAGTVRHDDPSLTVRLATGRDPRRIVLGTAPAGAAVHPCLEWTGTIDDLLETLGAEGVVQVMVEGGAQVAGSMLRGGHVQQVLLYLAPALFCGDDGVPVVAGPGAPTIDAVMRGRLASVDRLGEDLRLDFRPHEEREA